MLINSAIKKVKELKFDILALFTLDPDIPSYYKRIGWEEIGTDQFYSHTVNVMRKFI